MEEVEARVEDVIEEYIRPNSTLSEAEEIYTRLTGEQREFTRWEEVNRAFEDLNISDSEFNELLLVSKDVVEAGVTQMSESYLALTKSVNTTEIVDALERGDEDVKDIRYTVDENGEIRSRILYEVYSFEITSYGEMERLVEEKSIEFRISPQINLIIADTTYPPHIQRLKGILRSLDLDPVTLPSAEHFPDQNILQEFIEGFEQNDPELAKNPSLIEVSEVKFKNPDPDSEAVREVRLTGNDMIHHNRTSELLDEGWIITGISMKVGYENSIFNVIVGSSSVLTYVKVENIGTVDRGKRLLDELRDRYLSVIPMNY